MRSIRLIPVVRLAWIHAKRATPVSMREILIPPSPAWGTPKSTGVHAASYESGPLRPIAYRFAVEGFEMAGPLARMTAPPGVHIPELDTPTVTVVTTGRSGTFASRVGPAEYAAAAAVTRCT
jgi:hypothetical protein